MIFCIGIVVALFLSLAGCSVTMLTRSPHRAEDGRWFAKGLDDGLPKSSQTERDSAVDYDAVYCGRLPYVETTDILYFRFWPSGHYLSKEVPRDFEFRAEHLDDFHECFVGRWSVDNGKIILQHLNEAEPYLGELHRETGDLSADHSSFTIHFPALWIQGPKLVRPVVTYERLP